MADFSNLGEHCSFQYCKQKDFLPFTCSACSQVYCKEHFRFDDHDCPNKGVADKQVILCPICNSSLKLMGNEDPNVVFQRHVDSGECARKVQSGGGKAKQAKCPVSRCHEKLGPTNSYVCPACGIKVCLKHRFPDDHDCQGAKGKKASGYSSSSASTSVPRKKNPAAAVGKPKPKISVDTSNPGPQVFDLTAEDTPPARRAERREQQGRSRLSQQPSTNKMGAGRAARATGATWQCPRCTLINSLDRAVCEACEGPKVIAGGGDRKFASGCVLS